MSGTAFLVGGATSGGERFEPVKSPLRPGMEIAIVARVRKKPVDWIVPVVSAEALRRAAMPALDGDVDFIRGPMGQGIAPDRRHPPNGLRTAYSRPS